MKVQIIEVTNGVEAVFATLTIGKFRTIEQAQAIVDTRNRMWGSATTSYKLIEVA